MSRVSGLAAGVEMTSLTIGDWGRLKWPCKAQLSRYIPAAGAEAMTKARRVVDCPPCILKIAVATVYTRQQKRGEKGKKRFTTPSPPTSAGQFPFPLLIASFLRSRKALLPVQNVVARLPRILSPPTHQRCDEVHHNLSPSVI